MSTAQDAPQAKAQRRAPLAAAALLGAALAIPQANAAYMVDIDTHILAGAAARLDFYLLDGDGAENNSATISGLSVDGGPATSASLSDTGGFGEALVDLTLGAALRFGLDFSANFAGGDPDRLVLALLDQATGFSLVQTNLDLEDALAVNNAVLTLDYTGPTLLLRLATQSDPALGVTAVPSPAPWTLAAPWLLGLGWLEKRRRPAAARQS